MKHIKIFEEFEPDFDGGSANELSVGDSVNSYRGLGEIVEITGDIATVRLHNSKQNTARVPLTSLTKVSSTEIGSHKVRNTRSELSKLLSSAQDYYDYLRTECEYVETPEELEGQIDAEKLYDFLQDTTIEVMSMFKNDNSTGEYDEYSELVTMIASLTDLLVTVDPSYSERIDVLHAHFPS
jgi:hypothetical protein